VKEATVAERFFSIRRFIEKVSSSRDDEPGDGYFSVSSFRCVGLCGPVLKLWRTVPLMQVVTPATVSQCPFDPGAHSMRPSVVWQSRPSEPMQWVTPLTELQLSVSARVGVEKSKNPVRSADVAAAAR
jgi:hypothetical protein